MKFQCTHRIMCSMVDDWSPYCPGLNLWQFWELFNIDATVSLLVLLTFKNRLQLWMFWCFWHFSWTICCVFEFWHLVILYVRYCECFATGIYCDGCNCVNCHNTVASEAARREAVGAVLERNPNAFRPKIASSPLGARDRKVCESIQTETESNKTEMYSASGFTEDLLKLWTYSYIVCCWGHKYLQEYICSFLE